MRKSALVILLGLLFSTLCSVTAQAATITAKSCNTSDVQSAINAAAEGDTVNIPAGTCTWTSGVTVSGKGINIVGAGTSRIIAVASTSSAVPLQTGNLALTILGADPGHPTPSITTGQTLRVEETGTETNYLQGTVTSFNSGTMSLGMNITSTAGRCGINSLSNCKRWLIATVPTTATTIVNDDATNNALFSITEDTTFHTSVSELQVFSGTQGDGGTALGNVFSLNYASGGQAILLHDMRISENVNNTIPPDGNGSMILSNTDRGVIWNVTFDAAPFAGPDLESIYLKDATNNTHAWTEPDYMGTADTNGEHNVYIEDCDFHAIMYGPSIDDNGRMVIRYSMFDNTGVGTHGADTSDYGQRYFEFYNNVGVFEGYSDATTFNLQTWLWLRGGTAVVYNNVLPAIVSQDYGTHADVLMTVMNLQRNGGPDPCWGAGTSGGADYPAPRQVGFGYLTGKGKDGLGQSTDSITYVGDSDPLYIWDNTRVAGGAAVPLNVGMTDYGGSQCSNPDSTANYIKAGRDYFDTASTARPGWSPYTYPDPLRSGSAVSSTFPPAPTSVVGVVAAQ